MADERNRKGGGGKLSRTEVVGVRLDPRLRYLAELAARKHRRALSSFLEWAAEDVLQRISLGPAGAPSVWAEAKTLWDPHPANRYLALAGEHPELLSFPEQQIEGLLDDMVAIGESRTGRPAVSFRLANNEIDKQLVRDCWEEIDAVVEGRADADVLRAAMLERDTQSDGTISAAITDRFLSHLEAKGVLSKDTFKSLGATSPAQLAAKINDPPKTPRRSLGATSPAQLAAKINDPPKTPRRRG
jgi:hypothetical protein